MRRQGRHELCRILRPRLQSGSLQKTKQHCYISRLGCCSLAARPTEAIIGEAINGSWWAHAQGHHIQTIHEAVTESDQVLVRGVHQWQRHAGAAPSLAGTDSDCGPLRIRAACTGSTRAHAFRSPSATCSYVSAEDALVAFDIRVSPSPPAAKRVHAKP